MLRYTSLLRRVVIGGVVLSFVLARGAAAQFPGECVGDCDEHFVQVVGISDLVRAVGVALGEVPIERCEDVDLNRDATVGVDELVIAVINSLTGCSVRFPPTTCGDGFQYGEECDDANTADGDGCSAACDVEGAGPLDQEFPNDCYESGAIGIDYAWPAGQEFVPQVPTLTGVVVGLDRDRGEEIAVTAFVHRDVIAGEVLGMGTASVTEIGPGAFWQRIDFAPPIAVTPGERYVLQLVGPLAWRWVLGPTSAACPRYDPGDAIAFGEPEPDGDFLFRTYGAQVP